MNFARSAFVSTMLIASALATSASAELQPPCVNLRCPNSLGPNAQRLNDAFLSSLTTENQRQKMLEVIKTHTVGSTDWAAAADEYFEWIRVELGHKDPIISSAQIEQDTRDQDAKAKQAALRQTYTNCIEDLVSKNLNLPYSSYVSLDQSG